MKKSILGLLSLFVVGAAHAQLRVDSVDNAGRFLEHVSVDSAGNIRWAVFESGNDMNDEPLRSRCIRRQADEIHAWVRSFESSPSQSYMGKLLQWRRFVPDSKIAISWNHYRYPQFGTDDDRAAQAIQAAAYLPTWKGIFYNNVFLEVSPYPNADRSDCNIVTQVELETFFGMIAKCVSKFGANCRPL